MCGYASSQSGNYPGPRVPGSPGPRSSVPGPRSPFYTVPIRTTAVTVVGRINYHWWNDIHARETTVYGSGSLPECIGLRVGMVGRVGQCHAYEPGNWDS